jgi:hypothetical protein
MLTYPMEVLSYIGTWCTPCVPVINGLVHQIGFPPKQRTARSDRVFNVSSTSLIFSMPINTDLPIVSCRFPIVFHVMLKLNGQYQFKIQSKLFNYCYLLSMSIIFPMDWLSTSSSKFALSPLIIFG